MLTYQFRPRVLRVEARRELSFPAECAIRLHLQPSQPFGVTAAGGHTAVQNVAATAHFNANTGEHDIESAEPLAPLDVTIEEQLPPSAAQPDGSIRVIRFQGHEFSVTQTVQSLNEVTELLQSIYFVLPALLNVDFADPPFVERVDGTIGDAPFRWELAGWRVQYQITNQDRQERAAAQAWSRIAVLTEARRRLVAGIHYFHIACRLARSGRTAGEFTAEVVLNLAKCLEVLFPPGGDGRTRDAVRVGLAGLRFSPEEIDGNFLPAMALRNEIDVGHVELGLFTMDQLKVIHAYTERAEGAFRGMLGRLFSAIDKGEFDVETYDLHAPRAESIRLIERLRRYSEVLEPREREA